MTTLVKVLGHSSLVVALPAGSQPSGATELRIYSGEVAFDISSGGGTDSRDTIVIPLESAIAVADPSAEIIGWGAPSVPIPVVLPTSWNNGGSGGEPVIAINGPSLAYFSASTVPAGGTPGLFIQASVTVQHGSLLNAQYYCALLFKPVRRG